MSASNGHRFRSSLDDFDPFLTPSRKTASDERIKALEEYVQKGFDGVQKWANEVSGKISHGGSSAPKSYDEIKAYERDRERARREVKRELDEEDALNTREPLPVGISLADLLSRPAEEIPYRIQGVLPKDGRAILAAPMKAGKTTFIGNLLRSLADGDPFLDRFDVKPVTGRIVLFDFEMPEVLIQEWLRAQNIRNIGAIHIHSMRGRGDLFNILSPTIRAEWARMIRDLDGEIIIGDPIKPVLDSLGLSEHVEAGKLLTAFDALLKESEASEAVWTHHMGHNGERSRGDSTLRGWPDVEWKLVTERDQKTGERIPNTPVYFWAFGRDVDVPEAELKYDRETRRLTLADPLNPESRSRKNSAERKSEDRKETILAYIEDNPGSITQNLTDAKVYQPRDASLLRALVKEGLVHFVREGRAKFYYPGPAPESDDATAAEGETE